MRVPCVSLDCGEISGTGVGIACGDGPVDGGAGKTFSPGGITPVTEGGGGTMSEHIGLN